MTPKNILAIAGVITISVFYQYTSTATVGKSEVARSLNTTPSVKSVVSLYRPGRAVGAAVQTKIKVNGQDAGVTGPGTFFRWELKPGKYTFAASNTKSSAVVELDVEPQKLYFIKQDPRLGLTEGGRVTMKMLDEDTGKNAVKNLRLLVSACLQELG